MRQLPGLNVLNHASGKEAFARIVKMDSRARFNQTAYLAQFVFANCHYPCHVSLTLGPNEVNDVTLPLPRLPVPDALHLAAHWHLDSHWQLGIAKALHSAVPTYVPVVPPCAKSA